ncbi:hypothetical protein F5148DRAFT_1192124 [Russula earlei]|uniref:Uncharacterized protein n=1 Tax=Russula earlei TaxID=71964 RepID=A0ACC0UB01_9AGAM|nr:hypothetical protein F5148DRAFT_1192124 [Russula earlei]
MAILMPWVAAISDAITPASSFFWEGAVSALFDIFAPGNHLRTLRVAAWIQYTGLRSACTWNALSRHPLTINLPERLP